MIDDRKHIIARQLPNGQWWLRSTSRPYLHSVGNTFEQAFYYHCVGTKRLNRCPTDWETFARGVSEDLKRFYQRPWYVRAWLAATGKFTGKHISIG